jgi:UDP-3-O-[3-hydroxymyristoyl] glucosamine N-acyltransferase
MGLALGELAGRLGGELRGDPDCMISSVASLERAGQGAISFLANRAYRKHLTATRASAVILEAAFADECPTATITVANPYAAYARAASLLSEAPVTRCGVHPSAVIGAGCEIASSAWVGPHCIVEDGVVIAAGVQLTGACFIGRDSHIGADCVLHAHVVISDGVRIGERVMLHPGVVIGSDGFGMAHEHGHWLKVPQLGSVRIGNDVEVGAGSTIDRGSLDDTIIADGVKLDNQVRVAHNVRIGAHTAIAACTGIAGSTRLGSHCRIGGGAGILGHLEITDQVVITAMTLVTKSITRPGVYSSGIPAQENAVWNRTNARLRRLDRLVRKMRKIEQQVATLATGQEPTTTLTG